MHNKKTRLTRKHEEQCRLNKKHKPRKHGKHNIFQFEFQKTRRNQEPRNKTNTVKPPLKYLINVPGN